MNRTRQTAARGPVWLSVVRQGGRAALAGGLLAASLGAFPASGTERADVHTEARPTRSATQPGRARFGTMRPSAAARQVADWVVDSADNVGLPFAIVDKSDARVLVFDATGEILGDAPALLGFATGDDSVPGIGTRRLSTIRPEERTTPAGRFVVSLGRNLGGEEILWIDYEAAISLHRVITSNPKERRAQRLAGSAPQERRISYGCINVPLDFYDRVVSPAFTGTSGIVYVLPEIRSVREVFASYDVEEHARLRTDGAAGAIRTPAP